MLKKFIVVILVFIITGLIAGCETTGDPRQGGLFGWSEEKAVSRQENLKQTLSEEEAAAAREKQASIELQNRKAAKQAEIQRQKRRIAYLDKKVKQLRSKLNSTKALSAAKLKEKQNAEKQLARMQREITRLKYDKNNKKAAIKRKKKRIRELNQEIENLLKVIENL